MRQTYTYRKREREKERERERQRIKEREREREKKRARARQGEQYTHFTEFGKWKRIQHIKSLLTKLTDMSKCFVGTVHVLPLPTI